MLLKLNLIDINVVNSILFLMIAFEDFKERQIHTFLFVLLGVSLLIFQNFSSDLLINVMHLVLCIVSLTIFVSIKSGKLINITERHFGLGDILLLLIVSITNSFSSYLLLFFSTILVCLIYYVFFQKKSELKIPFAGILAIVQVLLIYLL